MSLFFVFTIDGDWDEYFATRRPEEERKPKHDTLISLIEAEIKLARLVGGKFIHFVHTSPLVRDFFLQPDFIKLWKKIEATGGEVGVHCHEEELYKDWYYDDPAKMEKTINFLYESLTNAGLTPKSYRGGYMTFSHKTIPILEQNGIFLDYSCAPGRHMIKNNALVSDWRNAPTNVYRMSYDDKAKIGDSRVFEIPLGIYIEQQSLWSVWTKLRQLRKNKGTTIVSVLAHTYDFTNWKMRWKMKIALLLCKKYGKFMDSSEALAKIKELGI